MTIDKAIENLQKAKLEGTKNIILAYWSADGFEREDNEDWSDDAETVEELMDWSGTHEDISMILSDIKSTDIGD